MESEHKIKQAADGAKAGTEMMIAKAEEAASHILKQAVADAKAATEMMIAKAEEEASTILNEANQRAKQILKEAYQHRHMAPGETPQEAYTVTISLHLIGATVFAGVVLTLLKRCCCRRRTYYR